MWYEALMYLPVSMVLSRVNLERPIILEGDLQESLKKLIETYVSKEHFEFLVNKDLKLSVSLTYPEDTSLWTIMDSVMARYHLILEIKSRDEHCITVRFREGAAWKH